MCENITFYDDFVLWGTNLTEEQGSYAIDVCLDLNIALGLEDYDSFFEILKNVSLEDLEVFEVVSNLWSKVIDL